MPDHDPSRSSRSPTLWIVALCTLWIAQPLYDLIGGTPDYFLVRGLGVSDIWLFGLLVFAAPPALLIVLAEGLGRLGIRRATYAGLVGALSALGTLLVLRVAVVSWAVPVPWRLAAPAAVLVAVLSARSLPWPATRQILRLVALLAPLAPLLFFLRPEIRGELTASWHLPDSEVAGRKNDVPVVVLVLDELPLATLLDETDTLSAEFFPHLAEFARSAGWYRGATTPRYFTQHALPALVAGTLGSERRLATARSYPANLFTLLRRSHHIVSDEPITALDPNRLLAPRAERLVAMASDSILVLAQAALPPEWTNGLPEPSLRAAVGRPRDPTERFEAFLERVAGEVPEDGKPLLIFSHLLLPHHPWLRDQNGELYDAGDEILIDGLEQADIGALRADWRQDWETVLDAYERHVLQARHADREVGLMLDLLRRHDLFDRSLIVVAADHGIHFAPGEPPRRPIDANRESLARVPLLVKLPGQIEGFVDQTPRSTLDVLPTVLAVLGLADAPGVPLLAGSSLLGPAPDRPEAVPAASPQLPTLRQKWLTRRATAGPEAFGPWHELLAGMKLQIGGVPTRDWIVDLDRTSRIESADPRLPLPRRVSGRLMPRRPEVLERLIEKEGRLPLGVALDGVMVASTWSSRAHAGDSAVEFSLLLPAAAVVPGSHQVVVYLLGFEGDRMLPLPIPRPLALPARLEGTRLLWKDPQGKALDLPLEPANAGAGAAVAVRFDGATAAMEIFGRVAVPTDAEVHAEVHKVLIFSGDQLLTEAEGFGDNGPRHRYGFGRAVSPTFHAVVPVPAAEGDLRVIALLSRHGGTQYRAIEVPLRARDESVWRLTGPFRLESDPRHPLPAFQNF